MDLPSLIYWKFDDETVRDGALRRARIDDLCRRSCFSHVYISLVWCEATTDTEAGHAAIADAARLLHERGRAIVVDIDVRPCRVRFAQRHPDALQGLCTAGVVTLDGAGQARWETACGSSGDHYGSYEVVDSQLLAAFACRPAGHFTHQPGSVARIEAACRVDERAAGRLALRIDAPDHAGARVMLYALHTFLYPDVFSDELVAFHDGLLDRYADVPLDGAAIDEWGLFPYPGFSFGMAWRDPWHSAGMARRYREEVGRELVEDCFRMVCAPDGDEASRTRATSDYYDFLRRRNVWIESHFYEGVKRRWGAGAFVGVHPTWYAIEPVLHSGVEIWKNGLDWWEVRRDFAQTDEHCPYAVRTALARRCGGTVWHNMWYSLGSHDARTYFREIRRGLRAGGRLHALGYLCPNESEVMELGRTEALEQVSALVERVRLLDVVQDGRPDCRVLVVFGYYSAVNWTVNAPEGQGWEHPRDVFATAYRVAIGLWEEGVPCDLVPSTEIDAGALTLNEQNAPVYCGHAYDRCIYLAPEFASRAQTGFLTRIAPERVAVCGTLSRDRDGAPVDAACEERLDALPQRFAARPSVPQLRAWAGEGAEPATPESGAMRFTDGMRVIVAGPDDAPAGRRLIVECRVDGRTVRACCEDFLAIRFAADGTLDRLAAPALGELEIDGRPALADLWGRDVAWRADAAPV